MRGYVLAGGRSRRMGTDKSLLPWHGTTLLGHAVERLCEAGTEPAILSANPEHERYGRLVRDLRADAGPLAGVEAALADAAGESLLLLAVDLPFVSVELLRLLITRSDLSGASWTFASEQGSPQPLASLLAPQLQAPLRAALNRGERAVLPTLLACAGSSIDLFCIESLRATGHFGTGGEIFANLNTQVEFRAFAAHPVHSSERSRRA